MLIFNPGRPLAEDEACGDIGSLPIRPNAEITLVLASFCSGARTLSEVQGRAPLAGFDDPLLAALVDRTLGDLLPSRNSSFFDDARVLPGR